MKSVTHKTILWLAVMGLMAFASTLALADDDDYGRSSGPQPDVARISLIHGDVSMQRGDSGDWTAATLNTPLVRGDIVATGDKSRTEVQLDYANILRLSSQSQAKIADLTRTHIQIQLSQGYAYYSTFKGSEADVEIDTPNVSVRPLKKGRYRIQINSDEETEVVVRDGEAEIDTPQGSTTVRDGHSIIIRGTAENAEYKVEDAPSGDDWDHWNKDRDRVIQDAQSWHKTNPYYTGSQDLDAYGHWVFIPGYGWVWQPYQDAAWAPYHDGRWVWEPYWGWTWVSYEPWGWAPYHYGRWFFWGGSWVWWPGPVTVGFRPVWAPAFVTFIGFGHHSSFAFGFGSIGWIPVGPFDPCFPWWGRGFNRVNVVNITNINVINVRNGGFIRPLGIRGRQPFISNVNMALRNERVRAGISGVDTDHFGRGDMRVRNLAVRDADLRESRVMTGNVPVVPTRDSLHTGAVREGMQSRGNERFFTHRQPPAALPGFHDQQARVERTMQAHNPGGEIPGARGDFHTQPGVANRSGGDFHTQPGVANRSGGEFHTQPGIANRSGGMNGNPGVAGRQDQNGRSAGDRVGANDHNAPGRMDSPGGSQPNDRGNRGGWTKFGPPAGGRSTVDMNDKGGRADHSPASGGNSPASRDRSNPSTGGQNGGGEDRGGFHRFPSASGNDRPSSQPDRTNSGPQSSGDRGGWQRFPSNSGGRQNDSPAGRGNEGGGKPQLELNKPIVTPRNSPPDGRNGGGFDRGNSGGPGRGNSGGGFDRGGSVDRGPAGRSGGGGGYDRGPGARSGGGGYDRGPAAHSGGGYGGGSHSNGGGGNRGGGGGGNRGGGGGGGEKGGGGRSSGPRSR